MSVDPPAGRCSVVRAPTEGAVLDEALRDVIRGTLRRHAGPRHVPAKILKVSDIPRTRGGKISELAVCDCVEGRPAGNTEALQDPAVLAEFRGRPELRQAFAFPASIRCPPAGNSILSSRGR